MRCILDKVILLDEFMVDLNKKNLILMAGPNGAGKTTSAYKLLPGFFKYNKFINADEIAHGLSPMNVDVVAIKASRIMLEQIQILINDSSSFALETTLSGLSYTKLIQAAQSKGYKVGLIFLYLRSQDLAKERVKNRVKHGGHNIPSKTIERRYNRGLSNLINHYYDLVDWLYVLDNSKQVVDGPNPVLFKNSKKEVFDPNLWEAINVQAKS